ncbi:uncharacterized protein LY89DRAFT_685985 [Mollisia scopiformis]|uniref:Uncharacterized protein n=1 Tax=Mollisia scopiformis TaxID=149040 RepID=A0A194X529_MOLSC|nr:uncharacterized protein LY89DRAFT_685985 [Mollisia scopiformis]KUJ15174.1 hypothetical protein LY89DRAFT_685985 [Mollisia scopiformis]
MPTLVTIPREIRDEIYSLTLAAPLPALPTRDRTRLSYPSSDSDETYFGENCVRFPHQTPLPPSHGLLHTSRRLRYELLDAIKRLGCIRYKVDIADRKNTGVLVPTWLSVPCLPCFVDKIDVLEVNWRPRFLKTTSVASFNGDDDREDVYWNRFSGSLSMLQRFVERGVYLLSKKKRQKTHIGCLEIRMNYPPEERVEDVDEICDFINAWMTTEHGEIAWEDESWEKEDEQFRLLAEKIDRVTLLANGALKREWVMSEMLVKRNEAEALRRERAENPVEEQEI